MCLHTLIIIINMDDGFTFMKFQILALVVWYMRQIGNILGILILISDKTMKYCKHVALFLFLVLSLTGCEVASQAPVDKTAELPEASESVALTSNDNDAPDDGNFNFTEVDQSTDVYYEDESQEPFKVTNVSHESLTPPSSLFDINSEYPFSSFLGNVSKVVIQHPLIGNYELSDAEMSEFVEKVAGYKALSYLDRPYTDDMGIMTAEFTFASGETWLMKVANFISCDVALDEDSALLLDYESVMPGKQLYSLYEAKLGETLPESLRPFAGITVDDIVSVTYSYSGSFVALDNRLDEFVSILRSLEINPQTGDCYMPTLFGGYSSHSATAHQFDVTFSDGSTVELGCNAGLCICGISYESANESLFNLC